MARAKALIANDPLRRWTTADALDLYNIPRWGCGYFSIDERGNMIVTPNGDAGGATDGESTWLHFPVCALELAGMTHLFDEHTARASVLAYDYTVLAGTQGMTNHAKLDRMIERGLVSPQTPGSSCPRQPAVTVSAPKSSHLLCWRVAGSASGNSARKAFMRRLRR